MEKVITAKKSSTQKVTTLRSNSKLMTTILSAIDEKKGENIISLDLRKIDEAVADFFILCDAQSQVQVKAIADHVIVKVKEDIGENAFHSEYGDAWTLIDYVNIVVHVFQKEVRKFYDLESLWIDAQHKKH